MIGEVVKEPNEKLCGIPVQVIRAVAVVLRKSVVKVVRGFATGEHGEQVVAASCDVFRVRLISEIMGKRVNAKSAVPDPVALQVQPLQSSPIRFY